MTLPQYAALTAYWRKSPPIHLLLGKLLGYNPLEQTRNDLSNLIAQFGPGGNIGAI